MTADPDGHRPVAEIAWVDGAPTSARFGDVYYSRSDGLAESRAVFLAGCGLPDAWSGRTGFTVAELGFGSGLNIAALLELWRRTHQPPARLSIFSVEAEPLGRADAARALGAWPEVAEAAEALLAGWPDGRRGAHRIDLPGFDATLDLYVGEVGEGLAGWDGPADAWFLDGFAPAKNPQMWRPEVLAAVGRLSAPGAAAASYTVAGFVRRGLAAAGFGVFKRPGYGAKRERLEARRTGDPHPAAQRWRVLGPPPSALVVGSGIAGAALARAFAAQGCACTVIDAMGPGAGASGAPAALVTPRLDAGLGPAARLHAQAFARAVDLYRRETAQAIIAEGALQLSRTPKDADRFERLSHWEGFADGALTVCAAPAWRQQLGEPQAPGDTSALRFADALTIEPASVLRTWLAGAARVAGRVERIVRVDGERWACLDAQGATLGEADIVCVAAGPASGALVDAPGLGPVRGQLEYVLSPVFDGEAAGWGAYAAPLRQGGVVFGASHRRGDAGVELREAETAANLDALRTQRPGLAARIGALDPSARRSWAAVRAATPDHLPLAGEIEPGVGLLAGLGGRGFSLAPLLAEHVVSRLTGRPSPLPTDLAARLDPCRYRADEPAGGAMR